MSTFKYISYFPRFDFTLYKYMFERNVSVDYFSKLSNLSAGAVPGFPVHMHIYVGVGSADFISFCLNIPSMKIK